MKKTDVKTWAGLVTFSTERAAKSIQRNDPIAWAYWKDTAVWAAESELGVLRDPQRWIEMVVFKLEAVWKLRDNDPRAAARLYSQAKWIRILSVNSGRGNVKPLSLAWLKHR